MANKPTDVRKLPAYSVAEAARYLKLPKATLRSWVVGRVYPRAGDHATSQPLIKLAQREPALLSFENLVEAHVLRALRSDHGVRLRELRKAILYAEKDLGIAHLLLSKDLVTTAGKVFLQKYGELIDLSHSGQLAMRRVFEDHLKRVEWDKWKFPIRLFPYVNATSTSDRSIAIDPKVSFGRPVILRRGISTRVIAERLDAGEDVEDLCIDYDLSRDEIEEAIVYERAA